VLYNLPNQSTTVGGKGGRGRERQRERERERERERKRETEREGGRGKDGMERVVVWRLIKPDCSVF